MKKTIFRPSSRVYFQPVTDFFPFDTYHVQGITFVNGCLYVSSTDAASHAGHLFKIAVENNKVRLLDHITLSFGPLIHPGGITRIDNRLIVPLAESRDRGETMFFTVHDDNLAAEHMFTVQTHIGAVASDGEEVLFCADFDTRTLYAWSIKGELLHVQSNPTTIAYQDMVFYKGQLYCSGVDKRNRSRGRVDVYRVEIDRIRSKERGPVDKHFSLECSLCLPPVRRCINLGREGMTIHDDQLFFLPEDGPDSRLYMVAEKP